MAKITRYNGNLQAFASGATGTNRTVFGDTAQSDALTDNINADYALGWETTPVNENPKKQDFNALAYTTTQLLSYLHQMGVAEYNAAQEYHTGSLCIYNGAMWQSTANNNIGHTPGTGNWSAGLRADDIGTTVQGYDAATAKTNVDTNFTAGLKSLGFEVITTDTIGSGGTGYLSVADIGVSVQGYDEATVKDNEVAMFLDDVYVIPEAAHAVMHVAAPAYYDAKLYLGNGATPVFLLMHDYSAAEDLIVKYDTNGIAIKSQIAFKLDGSVNVRHGELQVDGRRVLDTSDLLTGSAALVYLATDKSVVNNTNTAVQWDAEDYDDANIHSFGDNTKLIVPAGAARVRLSVKVVLSGSASVRSVAVWKNGSTAYNGAIEIDELEGVLSGTSPILNVVPGDYFTAVVRQESGSTVNVLGGVGYSCFAMEVIR